MADLSEVENSLAALIGRALFPQANDGYGTAQIGYGVAGSWSNPYLVGAPQVSPVLGFAVKLYRGWPEQASLNSDMLAGIAHCTVFPESGMTRNTTRYSPVARTLPGLAPTLTATVIFVGATPAVMLGGTTTAGNVVGVQLGGQAQSAAYAVVAGPYDTLATLAATLAGKIPGATIGATANIVLAPLLTANLTAVVACPQADLTELRRQDQGLRISAWCPSPDARDGLVSTVDRALATLRDAAGNPTRFFAVARGESGWLRYRSTLTNDFPSRVRVWRRDLCYSCEYPTTMIEMNPVMLFGGGDLTVS